MRISWSRRIWHHYSTSQLHQHVNNTYVFVVFFFTIRTMTSMRPTYRPVCGDNCFWNTRGQVWTIFLTCFQLCTCTLWNALAPQTSSQSCPSNRFSHENTCAKDSNRIHSTCFISRWLPALTKSICVHSQGRLSQICMGWLLTGLFWGMSNNCVSKTRNSEWDCGTHYLQFKRVLKAIKHD